MLPALAVSPCRAQTVNSYDPVVIVFCHLLQLRDKRPDKLRSAFAENTEDFRRFHSDSVVFVMQGFFEHRHVILVHVRSVRGYVV